MDSWERNRFGKSSSWGVPDTLGIVLVRFFFRLTAWVRFLVPLGLLLGASWGALDLVLGRLGLSVGFLKHSRKYLGALNFFLIMCFFVVFSAVSLGTCTSNCALSVYTSALHCAYGIPSSLLKRGNTPLTTLCRVLHMRRPERRKNIETIPIHTMHRESLRTLELYHSFEYANFPLVIAILDTQCIVIFYTSSAFSHSDTCPL